MTMKTLSKIWGRNSVYEREREICAARVHTLRSYQFLETHGPSNLHFSSVYWSNVSMMIFKDIQSKIWITVQIILISKKLRILFVFVIGDLHSRASMILSFFGRSSGCTLMMHSKYVYLYVQGSCILFTTVNWFWMTIKWNGNPVKGTYCCSSCYVDSKRNTILEQVAVCSRSAVRHCMSLYINHKY